MFGIPTGVPWVKIVAGLVLAALGYALGHNVGYKSGYGVGDKHGTDVTTAAYEGALGQQKAQAQALFAEAQANNDALKKDYDALKSQWKVDHDAAQATKDDLSRKLRSAVAANGRLRDPNATAAVGRTCGQDAGQAGAAGAGLGAVVPAEAGGVLSAELSGLLFRLTREADDVLTVANECSAAIKVK